jgi:hypothetical protein
MLSIGARLVLDCSSISRLFLPPRHGRLGEPASPRMVEVRSRTQPFPCAFCSGFALRLPGCRRRVGSIRENPTPAEGVAAWYEDKETALGKSRETGWANCWSRDSEQAKDPPPESKPRHWESPQEQDYQRGQETGPEQDQDGGQGKETKKSDDSETQGTSFTHSCCKRPAGCSGERGT